MPDENTNLMPWSGMDGTIPRSIIDRHGGTLQGLYDYYGGLNPAMRDDYWAAEIEDANRLATATSGWESAIDTLGGSRDAILNDPNMQAVFASLDEMMSPDYSAIGEAELAGLQGNLASGVNRAQSDRAAGLRRAGLSGSGMDIENAPLFAAIGSGALADVSASVDIANEQARQEATTQRGAFSLQQQGMLAPLDMALAGLQADVPISGWDPLVGLALDTEFDQMDRENVRYDEALAREQEQWEALQASQPWAWAPDWLQGLGNAFTDILNTALPTIGTGFNRQLPSGLFG